MKICINFGHALKGAGTGAVGYRNESQETRNVGNEIVRLLKENSNNEIIVADFNGSDNYVKAVNHANSKNVDLFVSIHFNASNGEGSGTETLVYNLKASNTEAKRIHSNIVALGFKDRKIKERKDLYVLKNTKMNALLVECCFVDNKEDTNRYDSKKMAKAITEGILNKTINVNNNAPAGQSLSNGSYTGCKAKVTSKELNVRYYRWINGISEPEIIGVLKQDDIVELEYCKDGWISIQGFNGDKGLGYVNSKYLQLI